MPFPVGLLVLWNEASISNGFRDIQRRIYHAMVDNDIDLDRPLNEGQGHSFWYQSIFSYTTSYMLLIIVLFALGRTV